MLSACSLDPMSLEGEQLLFRQRPNEDEAQDNEFTELPLFFKEAVVRKVKNELLLELNFNPDVKSTAIGFRILIEQVDKKTDPFECIFDEAQWTASKATSISLEWNDRLTIPDGLLVDWNGSAGKAFWPVVVESQITLPPVDALRNLPLEALIYILSSGKPIHWLIGTIEKIKSRNKRVNTEETVVDPHRLVDTSKFLLQRTRRVSHIMKTLRSRLERPVFTQESLSWRLYGPIGVTSLQSAILDEGRSDEEKSFLLAELALELSRVNPQETEISLKKEAIKSEIRKVLESIASLIYAQTRFSSTAVENYSVKAIQKAIYEL